MTELLLLLGQKESIVGATNFCKGVGPEVNRVGSLKIDLESILALRPSLVVAIQNRSQSNIFTAIEAAGIELLRLPTDSLKDLKNCLEELAKRLGATEKSNSYLQFLEKLTNSPKPEEQAPSVLVVVGWQPLYVATGEAFVSELIANLGFQNAYGDLKRPYIAADLEDVISRDPDYILDTTQGGVEKWRKKTQLSAVQANRLHAIQAVVPGSQLEQYLAELKKLLCE